MSERKQRDQLKDQVVFPLPESISRMPNGYSEFIADIKSKISS